MVSLPLSRAMICTEEHIFDVSFQVCPSCGCAHVMPLQKWLGTVNGSPYDRIFPSIEAWAAERRGRG